MILNTHFKLLLVVLMITAIYTLPTKATGIDYSGNIPAAQRAYPVLKKLFCKPGLSETNCDITNVRIIGNWAFYGWVDGEAAGTAIVKGSGNQWQRVVGSGGVVDIETAIKNGVPRATAQILVPVICPPYDLQEYKISRKDLSNCTAWDLLISRNYIFARNGRPFQTKELRDYFLTWPWYHPDPNYHDGLLNDIERANASLIMQVEKERGYL